MLLVALAMVFIIPLIVYLLSEPCPAARGFGLLMPCERSSKSLDGCPCKYEW